MTIADEQNIPCLECCTVVALTLTNMTIRSMAQQTSSLLHFLEKFFFFATYDRDEPVLVVAVARAQKLTVSANIRAVIAICIKGDIPATIKSESH